MTREEMATHLDRVGDELAAFPVEHIADATVVLAAAAELRKTCAGCKNFRPEVELVDSRKYTYCSVWQVGQPADGTGYCHRYEVK